MARSSSQPSQKGAATAGKSQEREETKKPIFAQLTPPRVLYHVQAEERMAKEKLADEESPKKSPTESKIDDKKTDYAPEVDDTPPKLVIDESRTQSPSPQPEHQEVPLAVEQHHSDDSIIVVEVDVVGYLQIMNQC